MTSCDKIVCVGKNYLDHAKELGDAVPDEPMFFFKPPSSLVTDLTKPVLLPKERGSVHHECEIVYRIKKTPDFDLVQVTLGLDLTLRDVQNELKKKGQPWEAAKAFAHSAVIGPWINVSDFPDHLKLPFELSVNGELKQKSTGDQMRKTPKDLLKIATHWFEICDGDIFFTGTPKGVGPIACADKIRLKWGSKIDFTVSFA